MSLLNELIEKLKCFTVDDTLHFEEMFDEQFHALKYLHSKSINDAVFLSLVVLNALISYQLSCSGERYWWEFARYFSNMKNIQFENIPEVFIEFLSKTTCGRRLRSQKISRIRRAWNVVKQYATRIDWLIKNQKTFSLKLARALNSAASAKTIVFSVKMLNYALRIVTKRKIISPMSVDIPLDSRIRTISKVLGVENSLEFWRMTSRRLGIPPLHLDSLLWIGFRLADHIEDISKFLEDRRIVEFLMVMRKIKQSLSHR